MPASSARRPLRALFALALAGTAWRLAACVNVPYTEPITGPRFRSMPPEAGASISATDLCKCQACDPAACCDGPDFTEDPDPSCATNPDPSRCGMVVKSCSSRCFEHAWRVPAGHACVEKRPDRCCSSG